MARRYNYKFNNILSPLATIITMAKKTSRIAQLQHRLLTLSFRFHLAISILIRLLLTAYGQMHDSISEVPYTDIDYRVVTDGARQIIHGQSPFNRHTYRYSPLLALLQIPNVVVHPTVGKLIYCLFDILVAVLIYAIVANELKSQKEEAIRLTLLKYGKNSTVEKIKKVDNCNSGSLSNIAKASACFWLYNPLTAVISTRGNGDCFSSFFVVLTIYFLTKSMHCKLGSRHYWLVFCAGVAHGFAIHLRLYPILFSLAYFFTLSKHTVKTLKDFLRVLLFPCAEQLVLVLGTILSLVVVTGYFYRLYGWQYIYEAYLYHFVRKDIRHNFSLYFLMQYLSGGNATVPSVYEKILVILPQFILILYLTFGFGQFRHTLPFCIFAIAFTAVTFNSVVTSQYFVWYLSLLPLCLNNFQSLGIGKCLQYFALWLIAQGLWLLPAYLLEFKAWNTFYWIGFQGLVFFVVNNFILCRLIEHYNLTSFKGNFSAKVK